MHKSEARSSSNLGRGTIMRASQPGVGRCGVALAVLVTLGGGAWWAFADEPAFPERSEESRRITIALDDKAGKKDEQPAKEPMKEPAKEPMKEPAKEPAKE